MVKLMSNRKTKALMNSIIQFKSEIPSNLPNQFKPTTQFNSTRQLETESEALLVYRLEALRSGTTALGLVELN